MSERTRKIESQLKEIVGEELSSLSDPRINGLVTVTAVRVSPDIGNATVFYSLLAGEDAAEAQVGLDSAAGRVQSAVGRQMRIRRTPRLHFQPDPIVDNVDRINAALRDIRKTGEDGDKDQ
ncbi:MAG: 30S ribosome-binding factor RbfA [Actinomycetota bacterium]|jgi:ribosome-binding factor A|nr:30S ribosome-binding factor RbfA [Actinomycetota bacterium]